MTEKPESPSDPRPNNEPYYIDTACPDCGTDLVLNDKYKDKDIDEDEIWHDEWVCPRCGSGVFLDVPDDSLTKQLIT